MRYKYFKTLLFPLTMKRKVGEVKDDRFTRKPIKTKIKHSSGGKNKKEKAFGKIKALLSLDVNLNVFVAFFI